MKVWCFKCPECSVGYELPQSETEGTSCEACGHSPLKRVFQLGGVRFKGLGWYSVDKRRTEGGTIGID